MAFEENTFILFVQIPFSVIRMILSAIVSDRDKHLCMFGIYIFFFAANQKLVNKLIIC